jgi:hypothetical protein
MMLGANVRKFLSLTMILGVFTGGMAAAITNLDWSLGLQYFEGSDGSEYGTFHDLYYTQLQWFF